MKGQSTLSNYEYSFEKLHEQQNLYEEIDKISEYQSGQPKR